jgi:superfamily II DNA or RNA helicase
MSSILELRDYQKLAVEKALEARRSTIKAPTGVGKTLMAIAWLSRISKDALVIVPTQALIYQAWAPKLEQYGFGDVGQYYAVAKRFGPVTITTFASAVSHPSIIDSVDVVIVDEIHHLGARTALIRLLPKLKEKEFVLGLSSVPEREDKAHELFLKEFPICYDLSLGTALREGYVAPVEVIEVPAPMNAKEKVQYDSLTEKIQQAFKFCGPDISRWTNCYDPDTRQYLGRFGIAAMSKRKRLLSDVESKRKAVLGIISEHPGKRIILFSESILAIEHMRLFLVDNGVTCQTFHAGTEPWRRLDILKEWGEEFDVLLSCRALEEGLDVKEVGIGILITSGRNKRQFVQRLGRVIRPLEEKKAKFYVVYSPQSVEETYSPTISRLLNSPTPI